jgi:hypothetical protein
MKRIVLLAALLWVQSSGAWAGTDAEIRHLLDFIGASGCTFVRNGEEHDAEAARSHIEMKYGHARRWIRTAEQFIEHTATQSSISREPYRVICAGREEYSGDWLKRELARFRGTGAH